MALNKIDFENRSLAVIAATCRRLLGVQEHEGFSEVHHQIFIAVACALCPTAPGFPNPNGTGSDEIAFTLVQSFPQETQTRLKHLLETFEAVTLVSLRYRKRFSALDAQSKDDVIASWVNSKVPHRRAAFHSLKALVMLSYYGVPNAWGAVGYSVENNPGIPKTLKEKTQ